MSELDWIKLRFDKVDEDNKDIKTCLDAVQKKVDRHGVYWDVTKYAVPVSIGAILSWLGYKKL